MGQENVFKIWLQKNFGKRILGDVSHWLTTMLTMAKYITDGVFQCNFCNRILPEHDFAVDGYRERTGRGPGRCFECDREVARARQSLSPTGKLGDCADNSAGYEMARETCAAHAWGSGWYSQADKAAARERENMERGEGVRDLTGGERRAEEQVRLETREREQVEELRELDRRAQERAVGGCGLGLEDAEAARVAEIVEADRKERVRALREARRDPDWRPEKFDG